MCLVALAGTWFFGNVPTKARAAESGREVRVIGDVHLDRVLFEQNLLPDSAHAGFGSLLYDEKGELVLHDGHKTWLYTTGLSERPSGDQRDWYGKWISYVREFDAKTLVSGPSKVVLGLADADRWAVIHDVIDVRPGLIVAFYSANGAVRAAVSDKPDGLFTAVRNFKIEVTDPWEKEGGRESSLESNGAHVLIRESHEAVTLWLGYDSYHVDRTAGQLGWAKVRIDKASRDVELMEKFPGNPLRLLPKGFIAARCGGNLATNIRLGNQHAFFYYSRPDTKKIMLTLALSPDPLFSRITKTVEIEPPLGDERVIEKFESYMLDDELHIVYENKLASNHWGTGIRIYKIHE
jgi:hypothetical protein